MGTIIVGLIVGGITVCVIRKMIRDKKTEKPVTAVGTADIAAGMPLKEKLKEKK